MMMLHHQHQQTILLLGLLLLCICLLDVNAIRRLPFERQGARQLGLVNEQEALKEEEQANNLLGGRGLVADPT